MPRPLSYLCYSLLSLALILAAADAAAESSPELRELIRDINSIRRDYRVPGLGFSLVSTEEILWSGGIGFADRATRQPATPDTPYQLDALSRTIAALAVLLASERDRLSLDDPLTALLPDGTPDNPWANTHPLRVAHLLEQSAGLLDVAPADTETAPLRCHWPPGLHASYSAAGPALAVAALQSRLDEPLAEFLQRSLFLPLDMQQARITLEALDQAPLASAYAADGRTPVAPAPGTLQPDVVATPREVTALLQLLLTRGKAGGRTLLKAPAMRRLEVPRTTLGAWKGLEFGYGLGNNPTLHRGFLLHGQDGAAGGHLSRYAYSHELGLAYLVVINARQPAALAELRVRIEDYLVGDSSATEPAHAALDAAQLRRLGGRYRALTHRFPSPDAEARLQKERVELEPSDSGLKLRTAQGKQHELLPVAAGLFRRAGQPLATSVFIEYGDDVYLQGEFGNYLRVRDSDTPGD
jgi:CubicO group peptidase (beta-lactamase class C family)